MAALLVNLDGPRMLSLQLPPSSAMPPEITCVRALWGPSPGCTRPQGYGPVPELLGFPVVHFLGTSIVGCKRALKFLDVDHELPGLIGNPTAALESGHDSRGVRAISSYHARQVVVLQLWPTAAGKLKRS